MLTSRIVLVVLATTLATGRGLQAQLSLGFIGGTVRYDNVATTGSLSVSPDLLITQAHLLFDANTGVASSTDGTRLIQGGSTLWAATPPFARHVQLTGLLQAQGTKPDGMASSSMVQGFGEVAVAGAGGGLAVGAGGVSGQLEGQPSVQALRTGVRVWKTSGTASFAVAAQPTRLAGTWFTDFSGRAQSNNGNLILLAGATLRRGSGITTSAGVDAALFWRPRGPLSFEATGGRYLRDPYQAFPAGWYVTAGVRFTLWTPPTSGLNSNVGLAALSMVGVAGQAGASTNPRNVPSVTKGTGSSNSGGGTGRGHRP